MRYPTIHNNGTSAEALKDAWREVYSSLHPVLDLMAKAAPNGRDYYLQGDTAYQEACSEFNAHVQAMHAAQDYFLSLFEHAESLTV